MKSDLAVMSGFDPMAARILSSMPQPPEHLPGVEFWLSSFWKLNTCRSLGMGEGPIPWTAIETYGRMYQLGEDQFSMLEDVVFELDRIYLKWRSDQQNKK